MPVEVTWNKKDLRDDVERAVMFSLTCGPMEAGKWRMTVQVAGAEVILASHWSILLILASHWSILLLLASYWLVTESAPTLRSCPPCQRRRG